MPRTRRSAHRHRRHRREEPAGAREGRRRALAVAARPPGAAPRQAVRQVPDRHRRLRRRVRRARRVLGHPRAGAPRPEGAARGAAVPVGARADQAAARVRRHLRAQDEGAQRRAGLHLPERRSGGRLEEGHAARAALRQRRPRHAQDQGDFLDRLHGEPRGAAEERDQRRALQLAAPTTTASSGACRCWPSTTAASTSRCRSP